MEENQLKIVNIGKDLKLNKNFPFYFIFDKYSNYLEGIVEEFYIQLYQLSFKEITENKLEGNFKNLMLKLSREIIKVLKEKNIDYGNSPLKLYERFFEDSSGRLKEICLISNRLESQMGEDLETYKTLQKLSRPSESTLFVGNLAVLGIYGVIKGSQTIYRNYNESIERKVFKNKREENFMNELYSAMEEFISNLVEKEFRNIYDYIAYSIDSESESKIGTLLEPLESYYYLYNLKSELPKLNDIFSKSKKDILEIIKIYPYSLRVWAAYFSKLELEELEEVERNLTIIKADELIEILKLAKDTHIFLNTNDIKELYIQMLKFSEESRLRLFNERYFNKVSKQELLLFTEILSYINGKGFKEIITEYKEFLGDLIKNNFENKIEEFSKDNIKLVVRYEKNLIDEFSKNILFKEFFNSEIIAAKIKSISIKYIEDQKMRTIESAKNIQEKINSEIEYLKELTLEERELMKHLILSDCFERSNKFKNKNLNKNLTSENIHLLWETRRGTGVITLTSIIFKNRKEIINILINDIEKVKLMETKDTLGIEVVLKNRKSYEIPILGNYNNPSKILAVKSIAIYLKFLNNLWKEEKVSDIYVEKYSHEIDSNYSKPIYLLEFIFNNNLSVERYYKIFLEDGFVSNQELIECEEEIKEIIEPFKTLREDSNKIIFPLDMTKEDKAKYIRKIENILGIKILDEILVLYIESEKLEDESILLLTEENLIITRNRFGVIPLRKINKIELKGFINHTLEIDLDNKKLKCLLATNDLDNKRFINIINQYFS
ncbi:MAG: hypothetical protein ACRC8M_08830 [Cetobacterium sp.]|uniref:hypothetical protein n=1 Tax=Cetobacterium sp. TaxID=2071632 RepID=UPI003F34AF86